MDEIAFAGARTLVKQIQEKEISSRELLDLFLSRIEKFDGDLNAVVCKRVEHARDLARKADDAVSKGESWGPLHGLPMTVKDSYDVEGLPTTFGIPQFRDNVVASNAVAIERLESAGAIVFGKTNILRGSNINVETKITRKLADGSKTKKPAKRPNKGRYSQTH